MKIIAALLFTTAVGSAWCAAPPMQAPLAPAIAADVALELANAVAKGKFAAYPGIYCGAIRMESLAGQAGGGAAAVWVLDYFIPGNGRDVAAEKLGMYDIWGTGKITVFADKSARVTCDPKVIPTRP